MVKGRRCTFAVLLLLAGIATANSPDKKKPAAPDFVIDPANRVGPITPYTSEADLIKKIGRAHV